MCSYDDMCRQYSVCSSAESGVCTCMDGFIQQEGLCGGREYLSGVNTQMGNKDVKNKLFLLSEREHIKDSCYYITFSLI